MKKKPNCSSQGEMLLTPELNVKNPPAEAINTITQIIIRLAPGVDNSIPEKNVNTPIRIVAIKKNITICENSASLVVFPNSFRLFKSWKKEVSVDHPCELFVSIKIHFQSVSTIKNPDELVVSRDNLPNRFPSDDVL